MATDTTPTTPPADAAPAKSWRRPGDWLKIVWSHRLALWENLNRPIAITLLSTILFGSVTNCIAGNQQTRKDRASVQVELVKLQSELKYRVWRLDQACAAFPSNPQLGASYDLTDPVRKVLNGGVFSDPSYKELHMAALIARFEMQAGIAHDGQTLEQIRLLERFSTVSKGQAETALNVLTAYEANRAGGVSRGDLPLKQRDFLPRPWLKVVPPTEPYLCGVTTPEARLQKQTPWFRRIGRRQ